MRGKNEADQGYYRLPGIYIDGLQHVCPGILVFNQLNFPHCGTDFAHLGRIRPVLKSDAIRPDEKLLFFRLGTHSWVLFLFSQSSKFQLS